MRNSFRMLAWGLAGLTLTGGLTLGAFAIAGKSLSSPSTPIRMVVPDLVSNSTETTKPTPKPKPKPKPSKKPGHRPSQHPSSPGTPATSAPPVYVPPSPVHTTAPSPHDSGDSGHDGKPSGDD